VKLPDVDLATLGIWPPHDIQVMNITHGHQMEVRRFDAEQQRNLNNSYNDSAKSHGRFQHENLMSLENTRHQGRLEFKKTCAKTTRYVKDKDVALSHLDVQKKDKDLDLEVVRAQSAKEVTIIVSAAVFLTVAVGIPLVC
jgi:hypothetical protein